GKDVNWGLTTIDLASGRSRQLLALGGRFVGRPLWMPDGDAVVATIAESTLGRGQLQSIAYPSGAMFRITNDLSDYSTALDMTRDAKTVAAIQRTRVSDLWRLPLGDSAHASQVTSGEQVYSQIVAGPAGKVVAANLGGDLWELNQDGSG